MHINLTPIDWIILAVYLVGCMGAGLWMRRFVKGVEDFAIAGRAVNTYLGIASLAATEMGLVTVMYTAQLGFTRGSRARPAARLWRPQCFCGTVLVLSSPASPRGRDDDSGIV